MCPIAVVLADVDLPYCTSKIQHIAAFTAIFSNICTAHAQKRLFMNFRCKFRHRRSIPRFTWPGDLDLWPFDLEQLSYMAGHVTNPATKCEDPTTIRSWVTSYEVSHWLALKIRTRPLRIRRITWPVSRGSKTITFLESPSPICLFSIQLLLGYDDD